MSTDADQGSDQRPDQDGLSLQLDEPGATRQDWEKAAAAVLRKSRRLGEDDPDADVWQALTRSTLDGIAVPPIGYAEPDAEIAEQARPRRTGDWDIRIVATDESTAEQVVEELETGATSVWLRVAADADLPALLDGVMLDLAPVVLDATSDPAALAAAFLDHADGGELHADTNLGADAASLEQLARVAAEHGLRAAVVDATAVHDAGGSDAQELGYALAVGTACLRRLVDAGFSVAEAAGLLEFRFAATDEQFPTIAKLRAARRIWARVLDASGVEQPVEQRQHAVTSRPMMSKYDPYVNMLRTTVAAFAAGVGGADAVTVLAFDTPLGVPSGFGRRIARNQSSLLMAESHVAAVADPAGGSYAVEALTEELAAAGWAEFGRIEAEVGEAGGSDTAAAEGLAALPGLAGRVADVAARREAQIEDRSRPLTGLTEFPNLAETLPTRPEPARPDDVRRYGAAFEALRDEPAGTPVFLATLGPVAAHTARATFATNLLAAGGVGVEIAGATGSAADVLAAYAGQPVVCLAGADPTYAEWAAELVPALREAGATRIILAGRPDVLPDGVEVDDSCAVGVNAYEFLTRTREALR